MKFEKKMIKNEVVETDRRCAFFGHIAYCLTDKKRIQTFTFLSFGIMGFIVEL